MPEAVASDWLSTNFGSLCLRIVNGGTPETDVPSYWDGDTPWITGADFTARGVGEFRRYVSERGIRASATSVVKQGNLLVVTRTGVGKLAIAPCDIAISQDITGVYVDPQKADTEFVYYLLSRELEELKKLNQGTSINGIVRGDLEKHVVSFPRDPSVQKKLVAIFRGIDTAIEKTEALIAKHQQIKAGLMHDLFTRGVLPNGQLRPPRSEAPELYQETALGWIPCDWAVAALSDTVNPARPIVYGILMPGYGHPGGVPVVKVKDIRDRSIDAANLLLTSPAIDQEYRRSRLKGGDVLFTIRGTVGRVSLVPEVLENANITQDTARIDLLGVSNTFISLFMESSAAKRFFEINTLGVAVQGINLGELRKLPIPIPSQAEQEAITTRLLRCLEYIENEVSKKRKLETQKLGLMQDLLTGRVPVPAAEPEPVHA